MNVLINSLTWLVGKYRHIVQNCYNLVEFLKNSRNIHPIAGCKGIFRVSDIIISTPMLSHIIMDLVWMEHWEKDGNLYVNQRS